MESVIPPEVHRALAVATAERRSTQTSTQAWKRKALIARATLNKLSASLRQLQRVQEANESEPVALQLLQVLDHPSDACCGSDCEPFGSQETAEAVLKRSSQLHQFINAVEVINAVKDLSEGELSRMWNRDPMLQLSTALHESIFKLPPSKLQSHYLENAKHALLALVDRGVQASSLQRVSVSLLQELDTASEEWTDRIEEQCTTHTQATTGLPSSAPHRLTQTSCDKAAVTYFLHSVSPHPVIGSYLLKGCLQRLSAHMCRMHNCENLNIAMAAANSALGMMLVAEELLQHLSTWLEAPQLQRRRSDDYLWHGNETEKARPEAVGQGPSKKHRCLSQCTTANLSEHCSWQPCGSQVGKPAMQCGSMYLNATINTCAPGEEALEKIEESMALIWQLHERCKHAESGLLPLIRLKIKNLLCVATAALQLVSEKANERGGNLRSQALPPSAEPRAQGLLDNCRKVLLGSLR